MQTVPDITVSLWAAKVPFAGFVADHHWFVVDNAGVSSRWEVWQKRNMCEHSWGYLHFNLLPIHCGVGNGGAQQLEQWHGADASTLLQRIEAAPEQYPWCNLYRYWPGPNSNTYVQWVLQDLHTLGHRALGKQYYQFFA